MTFDRRTLLVSGTGAAIVAGCKASDGSQGKLGGIDATVLLAGAATSNKSSVGQEPPYVDQIGNSFDSVTDDLKQKLAVGGIKATNISPDADYRQNSLVWDMIEDQSHYQARVRSSAKARGRYSLFSARAGGSSSKVEVKDSYSLSINCVAMRYGDAITFEGRPQIDSQVDQMIRRARGNKAELLKLLGDSYVHAVTPANSLFVEILFQTASASKMRDLKAQVSGSVSGLGSGSGSYGSLIGKATAHKSLKVRAWGIDGRDVLVNLNAQEIAGALSRFFEDSTRPQFAICKYNPVSYLVSRQGGSLNFVDEGERLARERFATRITEYLEIIDNVAADARYVSENPDEFDPGTISRANDDLPKILAAGTKLEELGQDTFNEFRRDGLTNARFDRDRAAALMPSIEPYVQKEPPTVSPSPPRRRAQPERDYDRGRNDHGIAGGGNH